LRKFPCGQRNESLSPGKAERGGRGGRGSPGGGLNKEHTWAVEVCWPALIASRLRARKSLPGTCERNSPSGIESVTERQASPAGCEQANLPGAGSSRAPSSSWSLQARARAGQRALAGSARGDVCSRGEAGAPAPASSASRSSALPNVWPVPGRSYVVGLTLASSVRTSSGLENGCVPVRRRHAQPPTATTSRQHSRREATQTRRPSGRPTPISGEQAAPKAAPSRRPPSRESTSRALPLPGLSARVLRMAALRCGG
jgi:hypothetical protein